MTLRRALLVIAAGIGLSFVAARAIERALLAASVLSASRQALIHQARHVVSYVITTRGWTTFELPSGHADVKLETNAVCPRGPVGPGEEVRYALRYRLTSGDETLRDGIYHFRSRRTDFATDEAGIRGERLFFLESEWVPADGRLLRLDLHGLDRGRKNCPFDSRRAMARSITRSRASSINVSFPRPSISFGGNVSARERGSALRVSTSTRQTS